jgi:hypothetical protein
MACVEGDGNDGVIAHIGEVLDGAEAEFFVNDDIAGTKRRQLTSHRRDRRELQPQITQIYTDLVAATPDCVSKQLESRAGRHKRRKINHRFDTD